MSCRSRMLGSKVFLSDPTPTKANENVKNYFPKYLQQKGSAVVCTIKVSVQFERAKLTFILKKQKKKKFLLEGGSFILKRMKKEKISSDISPKKKESSSKVSSSKGTSNNKNFYFYLDNEECEGGATYRYSADDRW